MKSSLSFSRCFPVIPHPRSEFTPECEIWMLVPVDDAYRVLVKGNEIPSPERPGKQRGHTITYQLHSLLYSCYLIYTTEFLGWFYPKILLFLYDYLNIYHFIPLIIIVKIENFNDEDLIPI